MTDELDNSENNEVGSSESAPGKRKIFRKSASKQTTHLGFITFLITIALVASGIFFSGGFSSQSAAQSVDPPQEALNVSALSTAWSCPIAGNPNETDAVMLTNADIERSAQVKIVAHAQDGSVLGRVNKDIDPQSTLVVPLLEVTSELDASLYIESFAGSIVPFRILNLSDGIEYVKCETTTSSSQYYLGLETLRSSNATLVLANPYAQAVVVDILAYLSDATVDPPISTIGESRGVVISGRGRTTINLQEEYGRYSVLNLKVVSRSGFFSGEALQAYDGANDVFGQTIVTSYDPLAVARKSFVPGVSPNRIIGFNDEEITQTVAHEAFGLDERFVIGEPQIFLASSSNLIEVLGEDFGVRMLSFSLEKADQGSKGLFLSWTRKANNSVSSGSSALKAAKAFLVPASGGDILYVYNPSDKVSSVEIEYSLNGEVTKVDVEPQSYQAIAIGIDDPNASFVMTVTSDRNIFIGSSNEIQSRYSSGINLSK